MKTGLAILVVAVVLFIYCLVYGIYTLIGGDKLGWLDLLFAAILLFALLRPLTHDTA